MNENENTFAAPDFSGIPSLGDTQGLDNYLNAEALAAQGLTPVEQPAPAPETPAAPATETTPSPLTTSTPAGFTKEQLADLVSKVDNINKQLGNNRQAATPQTAPTTGGYSQQEQAFITAALQKGYSLDQIQQAITQRRAQTGVGNPQTLAMEQRIAAMEQFLRTQQYQQAQDAFISKVSNFGSKWGLSDTDIETFANEALKHGINIAMENVDLEMVFRAVYPKQYAIRSQRMTHTNASQIYGGTSIPEGNRAQSARAEDAYVEAFLKNAMPNQYGMLNKK